MELPRRLAAMTSSGSDHVFFDGPDGYAELGPTPYVDPRHHLDDELQLADRRLHRAKAVLAGEPTAVLDAEIETRRSWIDERIAATPDVLSLVELAARLALTVAEFETILVLVAVEVDARRLTLVATGDRAPLAMTAALLHAALATVRTTRADWLAQLFGAESLLARGLVLRIDDPNPQLPGSAAPLRLSRSVLGAVLGTAIREPVLDGILTSPRVERAWLGSDDLVRLGATLRGGRGIALWISGGADGLELAAAVAAAAGRSLQGIDLRAIVREPGWGRARIWHALHLDQRLHGWVGLLDLRDTAAGPPDWASELRALNEAAAGPLIAVSDGDVPGLSVVASTALRHELARPGAAERRVAWERALAGAGTSLAPHQIVELADSFPMTASEIRDAVAASHRMVHGGARPGPDSYRTACLARQHARLGRLADFVPHGFTWEDLVLPDDELDRLLEIVARHVHRHTVLGDWNLAAKLPYGTGTAAVFSGPAGTGKTMAASVIAAELGRELYRVDLSRVVDKFIGETEKNLGRIFDAAADADALLLFDEADSLFGKRTQVSSSNDRYANLETNYLLQRIEQHPGISILTTNHVQNIDEAFARRIPFRVEFPFPDGAARAEIWRRCFTSAVPRDDIDFDRLGHEFELSGGHIKSAVVRAAFMAAAEGTRVTRELLHRAGMRELESMGKLAFAPAVRPRPR
jgi:hypothetical protein